ncbi:Predicted regulator of Ras-like GTPase activity, Roadblock/LC7/MglB family [Marinactinospora thermotolerans DSM 45154]|uniref:Predicted regulator of Ras-like GTPase activity, Roadblock/LC7/MglB family n=1 Tax=Marinactinospora thermotolerans DSM 45154 TaxID=1122192 RepID=A0A1T4QHS1_9ACTN|nr:roadblock/LC7 domain-containing protein [Marinactinospora thermotolerans]SKA03186.1 Predicted regulator of Ras-like GTPase activity, Roadblock/LC7/MglB family [Marinactinospora thermotolerans DSM 45154]
MTVTKNAPRDLDWLLDELVDRAVGAQYAIVLSADGLLIGKSRELGKDDAEHLSALASAFQSLAKGTGRQFGGGRVLQTVVEMEHAYLFVTGAGNGACLAVVAGEESDVGLIAYEMNVLVEQVGKFLDAAPRNGEEQANTESASLEADR